jgi:hypothetical protein
MADGASAPFENRGQRIADDEILRMLLVRALEQAQLVADRNRAFDIQCGKPAIESVKQWGKIDDARHALDRAGVVQPKQSAAAAIALRTGAERKQRAVLVVSERRKLGDRFEIGLLLLARHLIRRQLAVE